MTMRTAEKVKNAECVIFGGGHFPSSEDPEKFKEVLMPILKKIVQNDTKGRGGNGRDWSSRGADASANANRSAGQPSGRRVIDL